LTGRNSTWVKAEIADVTRKLLGQIAIGQPFVVALAPPRAEMNLVDRHRRSRCVDARGGRARARQPGLVEYDGRGAWAHFRGKRHRIGLQRQVLTLRADDIEFIMIARRGVGHEQLPITNAADPHRVSPRVPEIEIADDTDPPRIGGEHHETPRR